MVLRRLRAAVVLVLLMGALCACGATRPEPNENTFYLAIENRCDAKIIGIHFEYYLGEQPIGGGIVNHVDGSAIGKKELMYKDFIPHDFPERSDLSLFEIEILIVFADGTEVQAGKRIAIPVAYGSIYYLAITGNPQDGFDLIFTEAP